MTRKFTLYGLWISLLVFPLILLAQDNMSGNMQAGDSAMKGQAVTATGCLQQGKEPGGYYLTGEDGKAWELTGTKVKLADHVGHKVTVTGHPVQRTEAQEGKMATQEKSEAGGGQYADLHVSNLKMVSSSCK